MDYLDFELEIAPGAGREYPVTVLRSPTGEGRATMRFPFDQLALESRLKDLQIALLRSGGKRRRIPSKEEQAVQDFGQALFDALFTGEIRNLYDRSRDRAEREDRGLRLKLRVQTPELATLPWELLYDRRAGEFLVLSRHTPLVRYVELGQPARPLTVTPPLRILGMVASPKDQEVLDIAREKERVQRAIAELQRRGLVELTWLEGQTWRDLQRAMRGGPWHVFHFVGHGAFDVQADEGVLVLSGEDGYSRYLRATQLGRLLGDQRSLRLAVLNACEGARGGSTDVFSSTASILVRLGIPAVLAMQYEMTDQAAIELARSFYESLADGFAVDAAVGEARKAVSLDVENSVEWCTPVLYIRTAGGSLFDLSAPAAAPVQVTVPGDPEPSKTEPAGPLSEEWLAGSTIIASGAAGTASDYLTLDSETRLELVRVPAGEFLMGSDDMKDFDADDDELPQHTLYLAEFLIGKYPVTVAQFEAFVKETGYATRAERTGYAWVWIEAKWQSIKGANWRQPRGPEGGLEIQADHPVCQVSWYDAKAFCRWISKVTGRRALVPSEAEWEKAARGPDGRLYPWGKQPPTDRLCNFNWNVNGTTPVGLYSPGGDGLYGCSDMVGNVWEWTASLYRPYPYRADDGRNDPKPQDRRVMRGGSWCDDQRKIRCAYRHKEDPNSSDPFSGFRVVVSLSDSGS